MNTIFSKISIILFFIFFCFSFWNFSFTQEIEFRAHAGKIYNKKNNYSKAYEDYYTGLDIAINRMYYLGIMKQNEKQFISFSIENTKKIVFFHIGNIINHKYDGFITSNRNYDKFTYPFLYQQPLGGSFGVKIQYFSIDVQYYRNTNIASNYPHYHWEEQNESSLLKEVLYSNTLFHVPTKILILNFGMQWKFHHKSTKKNIGKVIDIAQSYWKLQLEGNKNQGLYNHLIFMWSYTYGEYISFFQKISILKNDTKKKYYIQFQVRYFHTPIANYFSLGIYQIYSKYFYTTVNIQLGNFQYLIGYLERKKREPNMPNKQRQIKNVISYKNIQLYYYIYKLMYHQNHLRIEHLIKGLRIFYGTGMEYKTTLYNFYIGIGKFPKNISTKSIFYNEFQIIFSVFFQSSIHKNPNSNFPFYPIYKFSNNIHRTIRYLQSYFYQESKFGIFTAFSYKGFSASCEIFTNIQKPTHIGIEVTIQYSHSLSKKQKYHPQETEYL